MQNVNPWLKAALLILILPLGAGFALLIALAALANSQGRSRG